METLTLTQFVQFAHPIQTETSLNWDSWEQYTFWKILTAQSVPLENFLSIIKSLNAESKFTMHIAIIRFQ